MDPTPETAPARMWRPVPRHFRGNMGKSAKSLGYHGLGVDMSQKMRFLQFYIIKHGDSSITIWNKENGNNEYGWYNGLVWINSNINHRCKTGLRVHWTLKNPGPIRTWPSLFGTVRWPNVPMAWSRQPDHCTVSCTPGIFIYVRFFTMLPTNFSPWNCPKMDSSSNPQIMAEWIPAGMLTPWHRHLRHEDNAPVRTILATRASQDLGWIHWHGLRSLNFFIVWPLSLSIYDQKIKTFTIIDLSNRSSTVVVSMFSSETCHVGHVPSISASWLEPESWPVMGSCFVAEEKRNSDRND